MLTRIARGVTSARETLLELLFPPRCVACQRVGEWFCPACRARIERIPPPWCRRCGRPLPSGDCSYCRHADLDIDGLRAMAFFEGALREAIHAFKYKRRPELASCFGVLLNDYLAAQPLPADVIVPVPLHPERERTRGYNQSLLIARELAVYQNLPMWYNVIKRTRATSPQVELDAAARRENVHDAFEATEEVAGRRVLLIDDVCTTGATMDACSRALKQRGAKSVWGLALARGR